MYNKIRETGNIYYEKMKEKATGPSPFHCYSQPQVPPLETTGKTFTDKTPYKMNRKFPNREMKLWSDSKIIEHIEV